MHGLQTSELPDDLLNYEQVSYLHRIVYSIMGGVCHDWPVYQYLIYIHIITLCPCFLAQERVVNDEYKEEEVP